MMYTNFAYEVWYTPPSQEHEERPVRFKLRSLPYRFIDITAQAMMKDENVQAGVQDYILENCIVDYDNIDCEYSHEYVLKNLETIIPSELRLEIVDKVSDLWVPSVKDMSIIATTVELMVDPRYSDSTWNCHNCQAKGLDKQRNCPFLNKADHDPLFKLPFMGDQVAECPVGAKDENLGRVILEGYTMQENKTLPESGGIGDQPILFILGSRLITNRLKHFERLAMEKSLKDKK